MYSALTVLVFASAALASPFSQQQLSNNAAQQQTLSRPWASALPHRESKLLNVTPESAKFAKVSSDDVESDAVYARKSMHYPARFSNPCPSLQQQSGWGAGQQQAVACDSVESDAVYARKGMHYPTRFNNPHPSLQQQSGWGTGQQQVVSGVLYKYPDIRDNRELFVTRPGVENLNISRMTPGEIERIRADAMQEQMGGGFTQQQLIPEFPRKSLLERGKHELFVTRPGVEKLKLGRMTPGKIEHIRADMMKTVMILLCAINALALATAEPEIVFESFAYGGSGCPFGSVSLEGNKLKFSDFNVSAGPGIPTSSNRKNCQINYNVRITSGWQFGLSEFEMEGYISLEDQLHKATLSSNVYFTGSVEKMKSSTSYVGPVKKDLMLREKFPLSSVVWSSCSNVRPMAINIVADLKGGNTVPGILDISGLQFKLDTRKCATQ